MHPGLPGHFELSCVTDGYENSELIKSSCRKFLDLGVSGPTAKHLQSLLASPQAYAESVTFHRDSEESIVYQITLDRHQNDDLCINFIVRLNKVSDLLQGSQDNQLKALHAYLNQFGASVAELSGGLTKYHLSGRGRVEKLLTHLVSLGYFGEFVLNLIECASYREFLKEVQPLKIIQETSDKVMFASKGMNDILGRTQNIEKRTVDLFVKGTQGNAKTAESACKELIPYRIKSPLHHSAVTSADKPPISHLSILTQNQETALVSASAQSSAKTSSEVQQTAKQAAAKGDSEQLGGTSTTVISNWFSSDSQSASTHKPVEPVSATKKAKDADSDDDWEEV